MFNIDMVEGGSSAESCRRRSTTMKLLRGELSEKLRAKSISETKGRVLCK